MFFFLWLLQSFDALHEIYCANTKGSDKYLMPSAETKNKPANHRDYIILSMDLFSR